MDSWIQGTTRVYAVLGDPVDHSLSPPMHNAAFRALGLDAVYVALRVPRARLGAVLPSLRDAGFGGVNLTVPLKEEAYRTVDRRGADAEALGAVNTVRFSGRGLEGFNTDGAGLLMALDARFDPDVKTGPALLVGAGGAARAAAIQLALAGCRDLRILNRTVDRARAVADEIARLAPGCSVRTGGPDAARELADGAILVLQATSLGLKADDPPPAPASIFGSGQCVMDMVYTQGETPFLREAAAAGAHTANGLEMLLHQGALAFQLWTGREPPVDIMRDALARAVRS
jgi:shikimate dehydrogenase